MKGNIFFCVELKSLLDMFKVSNYLIHKKGLVSICLKFCFSKSKHKGLKSSKLKTNLIKVYFCRSINAFFMNKILDKHKN